MRWILVCVIGLSFSKCFSQDLYLKLKSLDPEQDSILKISEPVKAYSDINSLKKDVNKKIELFQNKGYFNLRFSELKQENDSVFSTTINFREKYNYIAIANYNEYPEVFEELKPTIKTDQFENFVNLVLNNYAKQGKAFSKVKLINIRTTTSDTVIADFSIEESKIRKLDDIVIRGYKEFPKSFISNYANIKIGELFEKDKLIEKSERVELLRFASQKQSPQIQFTKDSTKLFLYLEKSQANTFDGFIGFNNTEENEFQLNGNIDLSLVNNFNSGEEINLNYRNDGNAQEWFEANVRLPYILRTRLSFEAGLGFFNQDSTFSNNNQYLKLDYQIRQNINFGGKVTFENSSNLEDENLTNNLADFEKQKYGIVFSYDTPRRLNNLFQSDRFINLSIGLANRESQLLAENQQYIELNSRQLFKIGKRQYIYLGLLAAFLNSNTYFNNELYRFGGVNSMRGFAENRFFANLYGILQTEYRYILGSNLYVHTVLDFGFYENQINSFSENIYSLGLGFGIQTKAGILKLILANGASSNQRFEFRNTQIHIKLLSLF